MRTLLITGPIGSGKSRVSDIFRKHGIAVYDCDAQAKNIYERHPELIAQMEQHFACSLRTEEGSLSRARLAELIFSDKEARLYVNSLVHPQVVKDFQAWTCQQSAEWVGIESALFLSPEAGATLDADYVLYVDAPMELRLQRVQSRDMATEQAARARIAAQGISSQDARITRCLMNDGSPEELEQKVLEIIQTI